MAERKYYDKDRFNKIIKHRNSNCYATLLKEYENYLESYPYDVFAITHYLDLCFLLNHLEKMAPYIEDMPITKKTTIADMYHLQKIKLKYYAISKKFEECYHLIQEVRDNPFFSREDIKIKLIQLNFYVRFQLGLLKEYEQETSTYLFQQIIDYDTARTINHVKSHIAEKEYDNEKFLRSLSMKDIIKNVEGNLPNAKHFNHQFFYNQYCFQFPRSGYVDGDTIDTFSVIAINHTNSIITMYPEKNYLNIPIIDITPTTMEDTPKIKRKSQIEKFNERYKK